MAKQSPFVKSNFKRRPNDNYPTIDSRCVAAVLEHFDLSGGVVDVCAPQGSGIVGALKQWKVAAKCAKNAFGRLPPNCKHIVTNPPYAKGIVDKIILHQLVRIVDGDVSSLFILVRTGFDHAITRRDMFDNHPNYAGQIKLLFRPWWTKRKKGDKGPIHNFVWHVWLAGVRKSSPIVMYSDGEYHG